MKTTIDVTYRIATPVFCAGADSRQAELRLTSFKGVLRFWWRALAWSVYEGDLKKIQRRENSVFGSASGAQSRVLMRLATSPASQIRRTRERLTTESGKVVDEGARYLGYGLMESFRNRKKGTEAGELTRSCILPPYDFTVALLCHNLDEDSVKLLCDALKAIGVLGGMGARSRRGYGSLVLSSLRVNEKPIWEPPSSYANLKEVIADLRSVYNLPGLPEYTALSSLSRYVVLEAQGTTPLEALNKIGCEMVRFRSWGHNGRILGSESAEKNFGQDHDLMQDPRPKKAYPLRIAFGLPQNYYFFSTRTESQVKPASAEFSRRASPVLIHIHDFQAAGALSAVVVTFLPARFLPEEETNGGRSFVSVGESRVDLPAEDRLYQPIHQFLDRLVDPGKRKERFSVSEEIKT